VQKKHSYKILSEKQITFIKLFLKNDDLRKKYYLSGGTALNEYYLAYRLSEDLDFFTEQDVDIQQLVVFFKSIQPHLPYKNLSLTESFNRNIILLEFSDETRKGIIPQGKPYSYGVLNPSLSSLARNHQPKADVQLARSIIKLEFTYFPFPRISPRLLRNGLSVDSLEDIAVNKLFTIYQKPRTRDFIDLYMIMQKNKQLTFSDLIQKAKIKFDWHINSSQLGNQLLKCVELKDYPKLLIPIKNANWQEFFLEQAKELQLH